MHFRSFLASRLSYIGTYIGYGLVGTLIVQLDLWMSGSSLRLVNLLYLWLLGLIALALFLLFDYWRWAPYLRHFAAISDQQHLDELGLLPPARSVEQKVFNQAWDTLYARLRAEVVQEQQKGQNNLELVSQWAHHMKTPVAVIDLELQRASKQPWPSELEPIVNSIAEENERLQHSLQTLLNMIRLEEFSADFKVEEINLAALVRQFINDHKREFIIHRVYPQVETNKIAPPELVVYSDAKWLTFVLEQVTSNAIKYSSRPGHDGHIAFRCNKDGDSTVLEISDNGIGIPLEDVNRVFSPFYTGANGRDFSQSTGMGLYLALQVCRRLGHQLSLDSTVGEGTQVFVRFADSRTSFSGLEPQKT